MHSTTLKDRIQIHIKTITQGALGQTVVWKPVEVRYGRVILLSARARADYMQLKSEVTHKVIFREGVSLSLGNNRLLWKAKTLEPVGPPETAGDTTTILTKEI